MRMKCLLFFALLILSIRATSPTLRSRLNLAGFDFLKRAGHHIVEREIPKITIPDFRIPIEAGPGTGYVDVSNLVVSKFKMPQFDYELSDEGLSWQSREGTIKIGGNWKAKYTLVIPLNEDGWVQALVSDINLNVSARAKALDGRPQLDIGACSVAITFVDVEIGGGVLPWLVNLFRVPLSKAITAAINAQACSTARDVLVVEANELLHKLPLHFSVGHNFFVDYQMTDDPLFTEMFAQADLIADIVYEENKCALPPTPLGSDAGTHPGMLTVWVSSQIANCLLSSAHNGGLLKYTVTKDVEDIASYLRTSCSLLSVCIGKLFKKLKTDYPNRFVDLHIHSYTRPELSFEENLATLNMTFAVDLFINPMDNSTDPLARLEVSTSSSIEPSISGNRIVGRLNNTSIEVAEVFSNIGEISPAFLSIFRKIFWASTTTIEKTILSKGIPIPIYDNVTLANSTAINIFNGYIRINADFEYIE